MSPDENQSEARNSVLWLVGLGPGPADLLTLASWELLASGHPLMIKDATHEAAQTVLSRGISFEVLGSSPDVAALRVIEWAAGHPLSVYAVPGDALDSPEALEILRLGHERGITVRVSPHGSDPQDLPGSDPLTLAHVIPESRRGARAFMRLLQVMGRLRGPDGCPWDREQTHASLAVHLLEETHEVLDAIDREDLDELKEELGDLLLQVVFHSELARQEGRFEVADVIEILLAKLFSRHPHVFGDVAVGGAHDVVVNWEAIKRQEKKRESPLDGLPKDLPALLYSYKVQRRLETSDFERPQHEDRIATLLDQREMSDVSEELVGELLLEVVSLAVRAGIDPEGALRKRTTIWAGKIESSQAQNPTEG